MLFHQTIMLVFILNIFKPVSVHLFRQIVDQLYKSLIAGCSHDNIMQRHIRFRHRCGISGHGLLFKLFTGIFQPFRLLHRDPVTGKLRTERIQRSSDFQHIFHTFFRDPRHFRSAARDHDDESFQFQFPDRLSDRCSADAELIGQMNLHQTLSRFQFSG